jgi:hypothetical protein
MPSSLTESQPLSSFYPERGCAAVFRLILALGLFVVKVVLS